MTLEQAGDLSLAVLLLLTLVWCILLLRKLRRINLDRRDVADLITGIDAATRRAETAVVGIRDAAREAQLMLSKDREQIDARATELVRLADGGSQIARRLENVLQGGARALAELQVAREQPGRPGHRLLGAASAGAKAGPVLASRPSPVAPGTRVASQADGALL